MALQGLNGFLVFQLLAFLEGKRLVFVKSLSWVEDEKALGSKVVLQIIEDKTKYAKPETNNFGEQLTVKVRGVSPEAFSKFKPLMTEVSVKDVERATVYGEYRNQLAIIGKVVPITPPATK